MLNLSQLINRTIKIKFDDSVVNVQEVSQKMFEEIIKIEQLSGLEAVEAQKEFLLRALNRNTSAKKFTAKEIDELPRAAIIAIWGELVKSSIDTAIDPN